MRAVGEGVELVLVFVLLIDVVGAVAVGALADVAAAVAEVQVELGLGQTLLAVLAELLGFVHFLNIINRPIHLG